MKPRHSQSGDNMKPNQDQRTPNADMQPEDAGTADSGNTGNSVRSSTADKAMKQTSRTEAERSRRDH